MILFDCFKYKIICKNRDKQNNIFFGTRHGGWRKFFSLSLEMTKEMIVFYEFYKVVTVGPFFHNDFEK